jgi:glutamate 5-kinase
VGVIGCKGQFDRGDVVTCIDEAGREVARGLVNYDSREAERLLGASSDRIEELLGYSGDIEIIHRDNLVLVE